MLWASCYFHNHGSNLDLAIPGKLTFGVYWALQDTFNEEPCGQSLGCPHLYSSVGRAVPVASPSTPGIWLCGLQVSCPSHVGPPDANQTWASSVHGFLALIFELPHQTPHSFKESWKNRFFHLKMLATHVCWFPQGRATLRGPCWPTWPLIVLSPARSGHDELPFFKNDSLLLFLP